MNQKARLDLFYQVISKIPHFPSVAVRSWIVAHYGDERLVKVALENLFLNASISRVVYRWQFDPHYEYLCRNPTPKKPRLVIEVNDMCPIYHRRVRAGYAVTPQGWTPDLHKNAERDAKIRGKFGGGEGHWMPGVKGR